MMTNRTVKTLFATMLLGLTLTMGAAFSALANTPAPEAEKTVKKIRKELVTKKS